MLLGSTNAARYAVQLSVAQCQNVVAVKTLLKILGYAVHHRQLFELSHCSVMYACQSFIQATPQFSGNE